MKFNRLIRILVLNYFVILVSIYTFSSVKCFGAGTEHGGGQGPVGRPQAEARKLPQTDKPFFRWQLPEDHFAGGIGRCSATGVDMSDLNVDLSGLTQGKGCVQLALTAAHCLEDAARGFFDTLADSESKNGEELLCRGQYSKGLKAKIDVSLPEGSSEAFLLSPKNSHSDIAVIAIPCSSNIQTFKLADSRGAAPTQMQVFMPMSAKQKNIPELQSLTRDLVKTAGPQSNPETHYSANPRDGEYVFNHGQLAISGDSGSPGFIKYSNETKPRLAAVLSGGAQGATINGVRMAAGLSLEGDQVNARANLEADIEKMLTGLKCGSSLKSDSQNKTEVAKGEASPMQTQNGQQGFQDLKTAKTPAEQKEEKERLAAQAQGEREVASQTAPLGESTNPHGFAQSVGSTVPQNPGGQHCEGGVCQVGPKQAGLGATGTDFFGPPSNPSQQGVQGQPVEQGTPEFQQPIAQQPSVQPSQGFKEVQATDEASFKQALRQARQDGVKHVIVTYGNYDRCPACRNLRDELQQQFGNDGDVRVIKMPEEFRPDAKGFIPQSRILTPKPNGMWEQSPTRVGSTGTAANYKAEVDRLRQTQPKQQEPQLSQGPAEQTGASQPQPQQTIAQAPETGAATPRFEDIKPEFEADGYKFAKESDGTLVRIGSDGQKKIPRLQQLPSGKSDLVYDAHPNSPVPFVRASNKERDKLRKYYLGIKGDATAWGKMPDSSKALIDGYLNNWDELANNNLLEALKAKESKPAEEPKVEPGKEEKPEKIRLTHEQFIDALGNRGISEVGTLSKDKDTTDALIGDQHIFWMKDDLTGNSYRFLYDETSKKLFHNPLSEVAAEPTEKQNEVKKKPELEDQDWARFARRALQGLPFAPGEKRQILDEFGDRMKKLVPRRKASRN